MTAAPEPQYVDPRPEPVGPSPHPPSLPRQLTSLTSLRFFAAFAVFVHHFNGLSATGGVWHIPVLFPYSKIGAQGVTFFFVLSGFLLTWGHRPRTPKRVFYWRRAGRIYPAHLVAAAAAVAVFYGLGDRHGDALSLLSSLLLLQTWLPDATPALPGNPVTWTLSVEVLFYALFPLLIGRVQRMRTRWLALCTLGGLTAMWAVRVAADHYLSAHDAAWVMRHPLVYLPEFLTGAACAIALRRGHRLPVRPWAVVVLMTAYAVLATRGRGWAGAVVAHQVKCTMLPAVAVLSVLLIAACAQNEGTGRARLLTRRPLILLGASSYAFYLVHQTVNQFLRLHWPHRLHESNEAIVFLLGTFLVAQTLAWLLYRWVEEPGQRWCAARAPGRRPQGADVAPGPADQLPT